MVGVNAETPVHAVRDLGIYIDSGFTMQAHVAETKSNCLTLLQQTCSILRTVTNPVLQSLVVSIVLTCLDYVAQLTALLKNFR